MAATPSPLAISVMLVDDHPVMRVGLANVLSLNHGFPTAPRPWPVDSNSAC